MTDHPPNQKEVESTGVADQSRSAGDIVRAFLRLDIYDQVRQLQALPAPDAADLIKQLPREQTVELLQRLSRAAAAAILNERPSNEQADLLGDMDREAARAILAVMDPREAENALALGRYPDDVAGGLMAREFVAYPQSYSVGQVVEDLRFHATEYRDFQVQYAYVIAPEKKLVGVLRLRDLLLADREVRIGDIMIRDPLAVSDSATLEELRAFFEWHRFLAVPVINAAGELVGVVQRTAVEEALSGRGESDYRKAQGIIGGEELRTMPVWTRTARRLTWLVANIALNLLAASVISWHEETLVAVIALAMFLPIISDMTGCAGNQAVAVSMRELALGLVRPQEVLRVCLQEAGLGIINGALLGVLLGLAAWAWKGNPYLGVVVGAALAINTLLAVTLGGSLPLLLKRWRFDPALASGPILTTITDLFGFLLVLQFAQGLLPWLTRIH